MRCHHAVSDFHDRDGAKIAVAPRNARGLDLSAVDEVSMIGSQSPPPQSLCLWDAMRYSQMAGLTIALYAAIRPISIASHGEGYGQQKSRRFSRGGSPDHNLGRNDVDDGTGAIAAIDIRPSDDSGDGHSRRSSKVCLAGIRG